MKEIYKLGNISIYPEQQEAAYEVRTAFERGQKSVLLLAQPQQGKTGVCLRVIEMLRNDWSKSGKSYEVILLINLSDKELKKQTRKRCIDAGFGLDKRVRIEHHAALYGGGNKLSTDYSVDKRLIVVDECHIALRKNKPFDVFLSEAGLLYGRDPKMWEDSNTYVLSVSATPYATIIQSKVSKGSFAVVKMPVSPDYHSLEDIEAQSRLKKSSAVYNKSTGITNFFKERVSELLQSCERDGPGYMIVRSTREGPEAIKKYILDNHPDNVGVRVFDCTLENIEELSQQLSVEPPKPNVFVIKGALRAGKTLASTKYIRLWVESVRSNPDAVAQVVGRCAGYKDDWGHLKSDDNFPIYCDTKNISEAIAFYKDYLSPKGNYSKSIRDKIRFEPVVVANSYEEAKEEFGETVSRISQTYRNDIADAILRGKSRLSHPDGTPRIICVDKANPNHKQSFISLGEQKPEVIGKCIRMVRSEKVSMKSLEGKLANGVMFPRKEKIIGEGTSPDGKKYKIIGREGAC